MSSTRSRSRALGEAAASSGQPEAGVGGAAAPLRVRAATAPPVSAPVAIIAGAPLFGFLSLLLPSAPTYDPVAWLIWGRESLDLDLSTVHGPSWKPLPVIVDDDHRAAGRGVGLHLGRGRARGAIGAILLSGVLAARLANRAAGVVAAVALAAMPWWLRNGAIGNSEGMMVALVLGAALSHLQGRKGWAFTPRLGAGLLRPEAWPSPRRSHAPSRWCGRIGRVSSDRRRPGRVAGAVVRAGVLGFR